MSDMLDYAPMRGRVYVEILRETSKWIILPDAAPRTEKIHRGKVLAMGPPARDKWGREVPPEFKPGDEVLYVYALATEKARRFGEIACVAQEEVTGVIES